jgi:anaerobic selenocysteine-containing dehydrogenase
MDVQAKTFCRICQGFCAVDVTLSDGRIEMIRGDRSDPVTQGYLCPKGLRNADLHHGEGRILTPLIRHAAGGHGPIGLDAALDQIAERLERIISRFGPRAVGVFTGTQAVFSAVNPLAANAFTAALGTPNRYGTMTIDQSAKWIAEARMGVFNGGPQRFDHSDVWMLVGTNPLVSITGGPGLSGFDMHNPVKALRAAKARGLRLIVIDPRRTETAQHADLFIQPRPGEDATLMAAILLIVLQKGWHDRAFCERYVDGIDYLMAALKPFDAQSAAARAGITADELYTAASMFALDGKRGMAGSGTGPDMAPHSNLAEHLLQCLNVVCGRYLKEGETAPNPGVLQPRVQRYADVTPPARSWMSGPRSRRLGLGMIRGQMMTAELADEMLLPGENRIRALICLGSNPAVALPDQRKAVAALKSLELLVTIDPRMSATARLSDFIIAPTLPFERHDHTGNFEQFFPRPYAHYAEPVVIPPAGAEVVDDWVVFWELARRLKLPMKLGGFDALAGARPSTEEMLVGLAVNSQTPLAEVRAHKGGGLFDVAPMIVAPARPGHDARLALAPDDVLQEIAILSNDQSRSGDRMDAGAFPFRLIVRRLREVMNSSLTDNPSILIKTKANYAYVHPDDLANLNIKDGEPMTITSATDSLVAIAHEDATLRLGMVSIAHCWGGLPDENLLAASTSLLVDSESDLQSINGMPVMTAIPVVITPLLPAGGLVIHNP